WWREKTDMEVYALRLGGAGFLTVYNRGKDTRQVEASLDLAPYGFDPSRPLHVWRFDPKTLADLEAENTGQLTEAQAAEIFTRTGRAPLRGVAATFVGNVPYPKDGRLSRALELESSGLAVFMFTQAPKLAYAKKSRPTHFLLPASDAGDEQTVRADAPLSEAVAEGRGVVALAGRPASRDSAASASEGTPFEGGAIVHAFSGAAKLDGKVIEIPTGGAIDATGLVVTTIKASRPAGAPPLEVWITYTRATDFPLLHKQVLASVDANSEGEVLLDLNQFAPKDWTGRVHLEAKGGGGTVRIIFNSKFQLF
ncbi:MAG TPA: hypothetical protein VHN79_12300, partial [Lacunisphaera sp.]|nr:hypothetical protein [Lacunisphaera sp.]